MMTLGIWDAVVVFAKATTYAATLAAAGGVFFLTYSHALLDSSCAGRLRRLIRTLVVIAALAGGARILATRASLSGHRGGRPRARLACAVLPGLRGRGRRLAPLGLGPA